MLERFGPGVLVSLLVGSMGLASAGCESDDGPAPAEPTGQVQLSINVIPSDVACLRITANGIARSSSFSFDVSAGTSFTKLLTGVPVGQVSFDAQAMPVPCAAVEVTTEPTWLGDAVSVNVATTGVTAVSVPMRRNGRVCVSVDFLDDLPCQETGSACALGTDCCSGTCTAGACAAPSPPAPVPPSCRLPADPGPCKALLPRWFFNAETGRCERFNYGGCGGNSNSFTTLADCQSRCFSSCPTNPCSLPIVPGPCDAAIPRFGFDSAGGQCKQFIYGGCGGNANNFTTLDACTTACPSRPDSACANILCQPHQKCQVTAGGEGYCADTCENFSCPAGKMCVLVPVACVREPCPPVANCK